MGNADLGRGSMVSELRVDTGRFDASAAVTRDQPRLVRRLSSLHAMYYDRGTMPLAEPEDRNLTVAHRGALLLLGRLHPGGFGSPCRRRRGRGGVGSPAGSRDRLARVPARSSSDG